MLQAGEIVQQLGLYLALGGYGLWVGAFLFRMVWLLRFRGLHLRALLVGFYARAAGTLGLMIMLTGMIMKGLLAWPWLIAVFVLGAPSMALLLARPVTTDPASLGLGPRAKPH